MKKLENKLNDLSIYSSKASESEDSCKGEYSTNSTNKSTSELAAYNAKKIRHMGIPKIWDTITDFKYKIHKKLG